MVMPLPHKSLIVIPLPHTVMSLGGGGFFWIQGFSSGVQEPQALATPLIPEARAEAGGLLRVQGQPVLAGREHKAFPSPRAARPPASPWRQGGDTEPLPPGGHGGIQRPGGRGASDVHSQSPPRLIHSLTVSPLPQKITQSQPPASENQLQSCPCLTSHS